MSHINENEVLSNDQRYGRYIAAKLSNAVNLAIGEGKASIKAGKYLTVKSSHSLNGSEGIDATLSDGKAELKVAAVNVTQKVYSDYSSYLIGKVKEAIDKIANEDPNNPYNITNFTEWYKAIAYVAAENGKYRTQKREFLNTIPLSAKDKKTLMSLANDAHKAVIFKIALPSSKATIANQATMHCGEYWEKKSAEDGLKMSKGKKGKAGKERTPEQIELASLNGQLQMKKNAATQLTQLGVTLPVELTDAIAKLEKEIAVLKAAK